MNDVTLRETPLKFTSSLEKGDAARNADILNLLPYAEALRDFVHECETPMSIGIEGDWGIGRTSLMNMLRGSSDGQQFGLLDAQVCKTISLESWPYSQFQKSDNMALACLFALVQKLGKVMEEETGVDPEELKIRLEAANRSLIVVLEQERDMMQGIYTDGQITPPYIDISGQMLCFKEAFEKLVSLWIESGNTRRIVIFIDDLDRIPPLMALELLDAINNFINVAGCVFVMALDYAVIQRGMVEKFGHDLQKASGKAYFDKLIQLPFVVPASSFELDEFIIGLLRQAGLPCIRNGDCDDAGRQFFVDITNFTVVET